MSVAAGEVGGRCSPAPSALPAAAACPAHHPAGQGQAPGGGGASCTQRCPSDAHDGSLLGGAGSSAQDPPARASARAQGPGRTSLGTLCVAPATQQDMRTLFSISLAHLPFALLSSDCGQVSREGSTCLGGPLCVCHPCPKRAGQQGGQHMGGPLCVGHPHPQHGRTPVCGPPAHTQKAPSGPCLALAAMPPPQNTPTPARGPRRSSLPAAGCGG